MTIGLATIALALAGSSPAAAEEPTNGECRQAFNDLFILASTVSSGEGTRGDFMSDFIFGNEPNMANGATGGPSEQEPGTKGGNVVATWSPGPFVNIPQAFNEPPRNDRTRGATGGDVQAFVRAACN